MTIGKVTVWRMTEEQRLAYLEKYPIVPTGKTVVTTENIDYKVVNERRKEALDRKGRMKDRVDKDKLHKLFMSGEKIHDIAETLNISVSTLNKILGEQRKIYPEKWPIRSKKK